MSLFTTTWTAANGAAWPDGWTTTTPATATTDIQSLKGRQVSATTAGFGPSARYNVTSAISDFELTCNIEFLTAATSYCLIAFRGDSYVANRGVPSNGYALYFAGTPSLQFFGFVSGTPVGLASVAPSISGAVFRIRLLVTTSNAIASMKAKLWNFADPEPDAWTLTASDGTYPSGFVGLGVESSAAAAEGMGWDDLVLTYPPGQPATPAVRRYYSLA